MNNFRSGKKKDYRQESSEEFLINKKEIDQRLIEKKDKEEKKED